jgi:ParB-like nuclease domain.
MDNTTIKNLGDKTYTISRKMLVQKDLKFYIENPRVYSAFDRSDKEPTQEEMEIAMCEMDDVKELKVTIEKNNGLITPILVKAGDNIVLEGNRRLAAYRMLYKKDPEKWAKIPCEVYPEDIDEKHIFILLGQCHINGQKKWAPFEEASFLYRRIKGAGHSFDYVSEELGIPKSNIKKRYEIYDFMVKYEDLDSNHWSYYEEYLKIKSIKRAREEIPELDRTVVNQIKGGIISDAKGEIREKLGVIAGLPNDRGLNLLTYFVNGDKTLNQCMEESEGHTIDVYRDLKKFREKMMDSRTKQSFDNIAPEEKKRYAVELDLIKSTVENMIKRLNEDLHTK